MSEVIEAYIRKNPDLGEKEAFDGFLQEERIKAWVGADDGRKERLRREFGRVWGSMHVEGQMTRGAGTHGPKAGPSGPTVGAVGSGRAVRVEVHPTPEEPVARHAPTPAHVPMGSSGGAHALGGGRRLQVMCARCKRIEVYVDDANTIQCRRCGHTYEDMLQLVRVTPVGPLEFLFGEGWVGYATAGGIAIAFLGLYMVLRWV